MRYRITLHRLAIAGLLSWGVASAAAPDPVRAGYSAFEQRQWRDAYEYWVPEADKGNAEAQFYLSRLFREGLGIEASEVTALTLLMLAAEGGHAPAAYRLGNHYHTGELIARDETRALYWWRRAAEQDDVDAQLWLAGLHETGRIVEQDRQQALAWYQRAADNGSQRARAALVRNGLSDRDDQPDSSRVDSTVADVWQSTLSAAALRIQPADRSTASGIYSNAGATVASQRSDRLLGRAVVLADPVQGQSLLRPESAGSASVPLSQNDLQWIESQPEDNFTLQLFSSDKRESAERVVRSLKSRWRVTIFPFDRFGYRWFGVLAGSFEEISQARQAKERLLADNAIETPWIRRFQNIRKRD